MNALCLSVNVWVRMCTCVCGCFYRCWLPTLPVVTSGENIRYCLICLSDTAISLSIPVVVYALIWPFKYTYIHSVITLVRQENITRPSSIDISLLWLHKLWVCVCLHNQACYCFESGYFQWPHRESHQPYLLLWAELLGSGTALRHSGPALTGVQIYFWIVKY